MMGSAGMSGGAWLVPGLSMVVLLAAVTVAVVVLVWLMQRRPVVVASGSGESRALAVARERYARGEIDHAELERILDTLLRTDDGPAPGRW